MTSTTDKDLSAQRRGSWERFARITRRQGPRARPGEQRLRKAFIAVLPFVNLGGDADTDYLVDGIVEDIITALSRNRGFFVIARNSSFTYKDRPVDVKQAARELGVRYVLEGSIRAPVTACG